VCCAGLLYEVWSDPDVGAGGGKWISSDVDVEQWATLDELLGLEAIAAAPAVGSGIGKLAF
jgi:hypothetical protein